MQSFKLKNIPFIIILSFSSSLYISFTHSTINVYAAEEEDPFNTSSSSIYDWFLKILLGFCFVWFMDAINQGENPSANSNEIREFPLEENFSVHLTFSAEKLHYLPPWLRWYHRDFTLYESNYNFISALVTSWSWLQQPLALLGGCVIFKAIRFLRNNLVVDSSKQLLEKVKNYRSKQKTNSK